MLSMTIPGIGAATAVSYVGGIEDPENVKRSRSVGARRCRRPVCGGDQASAFGDAVISDASGDRTCAR